MAYSYCRQRTLGRLRYLFLGVLLLLFGFFLMFFGLFGEEFPERDIMDYLLIIAGALIFLGGLYESFASLRDALRPGSSTLARSIRAQLEPDRQGLDTDQLFALVDEDIAAYGRWFGNIAVGRQWFFGDQVVALSRIRGIFYEISRIRQDNKTTYFYYLKLIDETNQLFLSHAEDKDALMSAYEFLRLCIPEARWGDDGAMTALHSLTSSQWEQFEQEFSAKREARLTKEAEQIRDREEFPQDVICYDVNGTASSRVSAALLAGQLDLLQEEGQVFRLEPLTPQLWPGRGIVQNLQCLFQDQGYYLVATCRTEGDGPALAFGRGTDWQGALEALIFFSKTKEPPESEDWQPLEVRKAPQRPSGQEPLLLSLWETAAEKNQ